MDDIPSKKGVIALIALGLFLVYMPSLHLSKVDYSYLEEYPLVQVPAREIKVQNADIINIIRSVFPSNLQEKAIQVAKCESTFNGKAHGDKNLTLIDPAYGETIGDSIGLFQIRTGGKNADGTVWNRARANGMSADQFREWMFDPLENAKYALTIYNRYGWSPWSCSGAS